jgi:hypothetical protein
MPKTKKNTQSEADEIDTYVRETCIELDTKYDAEALMLLCRGGAFGAEDGGLEINEAIARLRGDQDVERESDAIVRAQEIASGSQKADERRRAVLEMEQLEMTRASESIEVAYLLGIAIGRRLGPGALRTSGGAR